MIVITRLIRGGAQEATIQNILGLLKKNYHVVLAHGPADASMLRLLPEKNPNLELLYVPEFRRRILPIHDLFAFVRLFRYLRAHPVDAVHTQTSKAGIIGRWAARLAGVPIILHSPYGSIYRPIYHTEPLLRLFAWLERRTALFTDKILTVCDDEQKDYLRYGIARPEKFHTIYTGLAVKKYLDAHVDVRAKKKELGIPPDRWVIGYVARMTPEKGHLLCLAAFQKIVKEIPEALLVLVGSGPLENQIRGEIEKLNLRSHVLLSGFRTDIPEILPVFDCFIQASLMEGLPLAMVEAMLMQRPVVAAAVGGIPEAICDRKTGLLVSENNSDAIAEAVLYLRRHPNEASQMALNGKMFALQTFDIHLSVDRLAEIYEALAAKKIHGTFFQNAGTRNP